MYLLRFSYFYFYSQREARVTTPLAFHHRFTYSYCYYNDFCLPLLLLPLLFSTLPANTRAALGLMPPIPPAENHGEMSSLSESCAAKLAHTCPEELVNHNKTFLTRVYPNSSRVDSSNYNPQDFWNSGCQLGGWICTLFVLISGSQLVCFYPLFMILAFEFLHSFIYLFSFLFFFFNGGSAP